MVTFKRVSDPAADPTQQSPANLRFNRNFTQPPLTNLTFHRNLALTLTLPPNPLALRVILSFLPQQFPLPLGPQGQGVAGDNCWGKKLG